jgi:transcriptional regulator with XRE-family HTH domain
LPRLREVRELRGWSQGVLAEKADVSRDSISNYETGHREAYPATARKLADALDVEIGDLREPARVGEPVPLAEVPREAGPPRVSKDRLEEHFEGVRQNEVDYLNWTIADFWRLALPDEKPQPHFVPEDIDPNRVWRFLEHAFAAHNVFEPEEVERINQGVRKFALAGRDKDS